MKRLSFKSAGAFAHVLLLFIFCFITSIPSRAAESGTNDAKTGLGSTSQGTAATQNPKVPFEIKNSVIVTLIVACTTLGVLGAFIVIFLLLKTDHDGRYGQYFGNGLLMQMLVVLIISECVFALAVAGILQATEVGTIYGGIVGYVLGSRGKGDSERSAGATGSYGEGAARRQALPSVDK